jgi:iron complex outermembrane receptor protein
VTDGETGHPASFQMTVDNLANKRYWNSVTTSQFGAGMDRSFRFNFKYGF